MTSGTPADEPPAKTAKESLDALKQYAEDHKKPASPTPQAPTPPPAMPEPPTPETLTPEPDPSPKKSGLLDPFGLLLPYQKLWVNDDSRFKFGLMARQVGKDFASGYEGVRDCFLTEQKGGKTTWLIASPSERQSQEAFEKWKEWATVFKLAVADMQDEREDRRNSQSRLKSATLTFGGGSRVIAVPGRPDTVRGFSANILLTEFAFFDDPERTWRAILPSITNPLRGGKKKCRIITTPNGAGNKTHELWVKNYSPSSSSSSSNSAPSLSDSEPDSELRTAHSNWSCHHVDIYEAKLANLPINIDELKAALDDPEGWAQEYELQFLDQSTVLLPYDLIAACESPLATETQPPDFWLAKSAAEPIVLGIDFGRKQDLTVCWADALVGGMFAMTREVLTLKKMPTPEQVEILRPRLQRATRACLDYTGPGVGLGDYLVKEFGEWKPDAHKFGKIELVTFTNAIKVELFSKLRMAFEKRSVGIPVSRDIREDLHSVARVATAAGGVTYRAPHSADGHADRATAKALAERARSWRTGPFQYRAVKIERGMGGSRGALV